MIFLKQDEQFGQFEGNHCNVELWREKLLVHITGTKHDNEWLDFHVKGKAALYVPRPYEYGLLLFAENDAKRKVHDDMVPLYVPKDKK